MDAHLEQELRRSYDLLYQAGNALEDASRALVFTGDRQMASRLSHTVRRLASAVLAFGESDFKAADDLHEGAKKSLGVISNHAGKGQGSLGGAPEAQGHLATSQEVVEKERSR